jgi:hypothetical protein
VNESEEQPEQRTLKITAMKPVAVDRVVAAYVDDRFMSVLHRDPYRVSVPNP